MMLEPLEMRRMLSVTAFQNGETLQVWSNNQADNIEITFNGDVNGFNLLVRNNGGDVGKFDESTVDAIVVNLGGGNDTLIITDGGQTDPPEQLVINAGSGDDFVWVDPGTKLTAYINGGSGHDTLWGGGGRDSIFGGAGNDMISGNGGNDMLFGEGGNDILYGGNGNDFLSGGSGFDVAMGNNGADSSDGTNEIENL